MGGQTRKICAGTDVLDLPLSLRSDVYARMENRDGDWVLYRNIIPVLLPAAYIRQYKMYKSDKLFKNKHAFIVDKDFV